MSEVLDDIQFVCKSVKIFPDSFNPLLHEFYFPLIFEIYLKTSCYSLPTHKPSTHRNFLPRSLLISLIWSHIENATSEISKYFHLFYKVKWIIDRKLGWNEFENLPLFLKTHLMFLNTHPIHLRGWFFPTLLDSTITHYEFSSIYMNSIYMNFHIYRYEFSLTCTGSHCYFKVEVSESDCIKMFKISLSKHCRI